MSQNEAQPRAVEAVCARCAGTRWPVDFTGAGWVCYRCRAALAGRNAVDPLGRPATPAQLAALAKVRAPSNPDRLEATAAVQVTG
jgi:hypothetical protein